MTAVQPLSPLHLLLTSSGGDVRAARACAQALLDDSPRNPQSACARLILTAVCLHLYPVAGPDPTLADVRDFLIALAASEAAAWDALSGSSLALVKYAADDFDRGRGELQQDAISLAIQAVKSKMHTIM